jgi:hypothetical protein
MKRSKHQSSVRQRAKSLGIRGQLARAMPRKDSQATVLFRFLPGCSWQNAGWNCHFHGDAVRERPDLKGDVIRYVSSDRSFEKTGDRIARAVNGWGITREFSFK